MCVTRLLSIALICIVGMNGEDLTCAPSTSRTTHARLKSRILCDYDATIRPVVNHQNTTKLHFKLILKYFTYEITTSTLGLNAWLGMDWYDQHLKWNPNDYESIYNIVLDTFEIWTPDLSIYNRAVQGKDPTVMADTKCVVYNTGQIQCVPSVHIDALCVPDLRMYPFDIQTCSVRMGSWIHKEEELDLNLFEGMVFLGIMEDNGEWIITNYTVKKLRTQSETVIHPSIEIIFKIKRLAGAHVASVIIPTIVVITLTISILCMSPTNKDRIILCYVNLVVQFMHLQYMSWQVPLRGDHIPNLLLFARDSLLLSAFAIPFTIGFKKLMNQESPPPEWIRSILASVVATSPVRWILLGNYLVRGPASDEGEEDGAGIVNTEQYKIDDWKILGKFLDILLLGAYSIAYFVMALKFVP